MGIGWCTYLYHLDVVRNGWAIQRGQLCWSPHESNISPMKWGSSWSCPKGVAMLVTPPLLLSYQKKWWKKNKRNQNRTRKKEKKKAYHTWECNTKVKLYLKFCLLSNPTILCKGNHTIIEISPKYPCSSCTSWRLYL